MNYVNELDIRTKAKVIRAIELLEEFGIELSHPFVKHVRGKIWELRVNNERILYFIYKES